MSISIQFSPTRPRYEHFVQKSRGMQRDRYIDHECTEQFQPRYFMKP